MTVGLLAVDSAVFLVNDRVTLTREKVGVAFFFLINVICVDCWDKVTYVAESKAEINPCFRRQ